jgi:hypothetical protein
LEKILKLKISKPQRNGALKVLRRSDKKKEMALSPMIWLTRYAQQGKKNAGENILTLESIYIFKCHS